MLAALVFAMLVPRESPPAFVTELPIAATELSWEPTPPEPASAAQHVTAKVLQFGGAHVLGAAAALAGGLAAIPPALLLLRMDSGNLGGGVIACGAAAGYSLGAAGAIYTSGVEVTGVHGSLGMTALGVGAGIVLTGAVLATEALPEELMIAAAVLVPPIAGILVFEVTKEGPSVRMPVPQGAVAIFVVAGFAAAGYAATELATVDAPASRVLVPLVQVRW